MVEETPQSDLTAASAPALAEVKGPARPALLTSDLQSNYTALAAASRSAAAEEVLDNVRQKHLTSATTWENLALSAKGMEALREKRLAAQAEAANPNEGDHLLSPGAEPA